MDSTAEAKSKKIERRYDTLGKKRKRSIRFASSEVAVLPSMEDSSSSSSSPTNNAPKQNCTAVASASYGLISVIGRRRVMEDAVRVVPGFVPVEDESGGYDFFAVYDGHGGSMVANTCREKLHMLLAEEMKEAKAAGPLDWHQVMCSCFMKMDQEIVGDEGNDDMSGGNTMGSTATVVVVGKEEIVVGNCGDSRAVLCRGGEALPLSRDHKPDREDEKERIEAAGGRVIDWNGNRVLGVLATSRSIGDHYMKPFVIAQPEIQVSRRTDSDEFVVVASDGLWDVVSNSFACQLVRNYLSGKTDMTTSAEAAATLLAELAMARGSKDNITVIVIQLINAASPSTPSTST
ncbi:hypothetical protein HN51_068936 [Arachis hypogaea]|uniref:protein-serine/threonine phosphatase n=1 Tax=Arachis hypogaea TaxID=3818 RepID=A0A444Z896_ARAHY|nr:probable protein phosphatase 2C 51 [Arachis ipaensis]XP_025653863.1 protein phosphatase 2C 51 [Arachis hypogaea]QHO11101.1 putative protein phosphatase 2C [Arachis hypogaea]RYR10414.1 hypothetical protein Ahy_B05g078868 [Arachis hypogaea]